MIRIGATTQLVATLKDSSGLTLTPRPVTWVSLRPGIAIVSDAGLVTGVGSGIGLIEARSENQTGWASVTVNAPVASVSVTPPNTVVSLGSALAMTAMVRDAAGNILSGETIIWSSSNNGVASINANGRVIAGGLGGPVTISATVQGTTGVASVTVRTQASTSTLASLTPGYKTSCGVNASGAGFCWGDGGVGQLGNGDTQSATSPIPVTGGLSFASISPAMFHTCGLTTSGAAYCWGGGDMGEIGNGSTTQQLTPIAVSGGKTFSVIRTGSNFTCALDLGGDAYCWGDNQFGVLGNGTFIGSNVPVAVSGGLKFTSLVAGFQHVCGISTAGPAYCWGRDESGELGDGGPNTAATSRSTPTQVTGGISFKALAAGQRSTCGLDSAGAAYCWGVFWGGSRPAPARAPSSKPVPVSGGLVFTSIEMGNTHTCALKSDGAAYCWGSTTTPSLNPRAVSGGFTFASIRAGFGFTCGLTTGGVAYCWGQNEMGQLGIGSNADALTPVKVLGQP